MSALQPLNKASKGFTILKYLKNSYVNMCPNFVSSVICIFIPYLKFIYSEKATKFCEISTLLLTTVHTVKSKVEILKNFVAFHEYTNFTIALQFPNDILDFGSLLKLTEQVPGRAYLGKMLTPSIKPSLAINIIDGVVKSVLAVMTSHIRSMIYNGT